MKRYLTKFIWHTYICFVFLRITNLKMIFMEKIIEPDYSTGSFSFYNADNMDIL